MIKSHVNLWLSRFIKAKIPEPHLSLKYILEDVLERKFNDTLIHVNENGLTLSYNQISKIESLVYRREYHEPIQYVLGEWPFRELMLSQRCPVFIPRPETSGLVDLAKKHIRGNMYRVLDIGVGSGPICLSLLAETNLQQVFGVDRLPEAVKLTSENAQRHGVRERLQLCELELCGDVEVDVDKIAEWSDGSFDMIISNPPYIPTRRMRELEKQVLLYESADALCGGEDGLAVVARVMRASRHLLTGQGLLLLELDDSHLTAAEDGALVDNLRHLVALCHMQLLHVSVDLFRTPRFIILRKEV